jgi:hypothetical protein
VAHELGSQTLTTETDLGCNPNPSLLSTGSIFIREDAPLPGWFRFNYEERGGWRQLFDVNSYAFERLALMMGWHFFYILPAVRYKVYGLSREAVIRTALSKAMTAVGRSGFNSLEIAEFSTRSLTVLHSAYIEVNPRHLRPTPLLIDPKPYHHAYSVAEFEPIFWRAAQVPPQAKGI